MQYALLIFDHPAAHEVPQDEREAITGEYMAISGEDAVVGGAHLEPPETATTVRVADGQTLTTDGPFVNTKEFLGGFFLLEADSLDGALAVAERIPAARYGGCVEVRPIVERSER